MADFETIEAVESEYARQVRLAYLSAIKEASKLMPYGKLNDSGNLYLRSNATLRKKVDAIIDKLIADIEVVTVQGVFTGWDTAVEQNNEVAQRIYGKNLDELPNRYKEKYLSNNGDAKRAFATTKDSGFTISDRVWRNGKQYRQEIELSIESGLNRGISANKLAKEMQDQLVEPDKLFRRIRSQKDGSLRLSKAAKMYNPGQGVYRSSFQNAKRLARTEINAAYENSSKMKREQQDFIVGINIAVSKSHDPADDKGGISCYALQGNYPKDFDWSHKWHPNCKCIRKDILKGENELQDDLERIVSGGSPNNDSKNKVSKIPAKFNKYIKENEKLWKNWKNEPRFLKNIKSA